MVFYIQCRDEPIKIINKMSWYVECRYKETIIGVLKNIECWTI